jgi:predicted membrane protein
MINVLQLFVFIFFILFLFSITFLYLDSRIKYRKLLAGYAANQIEKEYFKKKLAEQLVNKETKRVEQTDGFLKFVSESRDWAFQYIESVQDSIKSLDEAKVLINNTNVKAADRKRALDIIDGVLKNLPD